MNYEKKLNKALERVNELQVQLRKLQEQIEEDNKPSYAEDTNININIKIATKSKKLAKSQMKLNRIAQK